VDALRQVEGWPADRAAVAVTGSAEASFGDTSRVFPWASVTKLASAVAMLVAAEEGIVDLDEPAGPPGATFRHLLAHASGLPFEGGGPPIARPGTRRIYSNTGFEALADAVAERAEMPFGDYLHAAVFEPLAMTRTELRGSPAAEVHGPLEDLVRFAGELLAPTVVSAETLAEATTVQFPGLAGILPGVGRYDPLDWGLGFELKDAKEGHWSGSRTSPGAFCHFGGSGTFLWVDPEPGVACICLTDREFGPWALEAWPPLSDAVLDEVRGPDSAPGPRTDRS